MKIQRLRNKIDKIDKNLLNLFENRIKISLKIAKHKISNDKNIFDIKRENEILKTIKKRSSQKFKQSNSFLFSTIINTGKFGQYKKIKTIPDNIKTILNISEKNTSKISVPRLAYLETNDSYSKIATSRAFPHSTINIYTFMSDLFDALDKNIIDLGVIELNNSLTNNIYDTLNKNNTYIYKILNLNASYCLAVNPKNKNPFKKIISTTQIIGQCSNYIKKHKYEKSHLELISEAAFLVSKLDEPLAIICPKEVALKYKLNIMEENVQDNIKNNKKFLVISKKISTAPNKHILSLSIKTNNTNKLLSNISTYFNINNIKLHQLQINTYTNKNNISTVYLDFIGNIKDTSTKAFINYLSYETTSFELLGYYSEETV